MMSIQTSVWDVLEVSGKNTGMIPDEPRRAPNVPSHLSIENFQLHCTRSVGGLSNQVSWGSSQRSTVATLELVLMMKGALGLARNQRKAVAVHEELSTGIGVADLGLLSQIVMNIIIVKRKLACSTAS